MAKRDDDMREVVEKILPKYANKVGQILARANFNGNYFGTANWDKPMSRKVMNLDGGVTGYEYKPQQRPGPDCFPDNCWIRFEDIRISEIDSLELGSIDEKPSGAGAQVAVSIDNDSPEPIELRERKEQEKETEKSEEHSFGIMVGTEFSLRTERSGGVSFKGIRAEQSVTAELTVRAEARTEHQWRKSARFRETVEREMGIIIAPWHRLDVTAMETTKDIRQPVTVTGVLEASVTIASLPYHTGWDRYKLWGESEAQERVGIYDTKFEKLEDLENVFRGLKADHGRVSKLFSQMGGVDESLIEDLERPRVTLKYDVKAPRTRFTKIRVKQTPIKNETKGKKSDSAKNIDAKDFMDDLDIPDEI